MPVVDLGPRTQAAPVPDRWHGMPRRIGLTRRELEHLADLLGCPLPFEPLVPDPAGAADTGLTDRLGSRPRPTADDHLDRALAHPQDPASTLARRGLVSDGLVEDGVRGALGLLAVPRLALDVDVRVQDTQVHAWHRQGGGAVATLATADGVVFELAWFALEHWGAELGRVARLPEEVDLRRSALPALVDLPFELLDAASEAGRTHRPDLLPVLAQRYAGTVLTEDRLPLDAVQVQGVLTAIAGESRGRLRALSTAVDEIGHPAGVVSWLLLGDGWHVLRAHGPGEALRIELKLVGPEELAGCVAPVLAEVAL